MAEDGGDSASATFAFADGDLLSFENLHVDVGPEIADAVTDVHWLADDSIEVAVHLPADLFPDTTADAFISQHAALPAGDWLIE